MEYYTQHNNGSLLYIFIAYLMLCYSAVFSITTLLSVICNKHIAETDIWYWNLLSGIYIYTPISTLIFTFDIIYQEHKQDIHGTPLFDDLADNNIIISPPLSLSLYIYIYIYMCVCVCVCMCVRGLA